MKNGMIFYAGAIMSLTHKLDEIAEGTKSAALKELVGQYERVWHQMLSSAGSSEFADEVARCFGLGDNDGSD